MADGLSISGGAGSVAAALDDPHCTSSMYEWLADWQLRATELATDRDPVRADAGTVGGPLGLGQPELVGEERRLRGVGPGHRRELIAAHGGVELVDQLHQLLVVAVHLGVVHRQAIRPVDEHGLGVTDDGEVVLGLELVWPDRLARR